MEYKNRLTNLSKILKRKRFTEEARLVSQIYKLSSVDSNSLIQAAINEFGITHDFNEAGYILPDGNMLDFSGKKEGGPAGTRSYDHRQICTVMDETTESPSEDMNLFMRDTGSIRVSAHGDYALFDMEKYPTPDQLKTIKEFIQFSNVSSVGVSLPGSRTEYVDNPTWREVARLIA